MAKKCTCGRSPIGKCIGVHDVPEEEWLEALESNRRGIYGDS